MGGVFKFKDVFRFVNLVKDVFLKSRRPGKLNNPSFSLKYQLRS